MANPTRRRFLQSAAAATVATALPPSLLLAAADAPTATTKPVRKLNIALIGTANRAGAHLAEVSALANANISVLCDVDSAYLAAANKKIPAATAFTDFRDAIKHPGVEAVLVATPDHTHAVIAAAALRAGKHVYCEKPLAHTLKEVRTLTKLAEESKLCTQLGIQIHSLDNYRRVVELIRAGAIGPVREVHMWNNRTNHPVDTTVCDPPASLNYDLWLGPVPSRPYQKSFHPFNWRRYWSFGEGLMGDIGCHYLDLPFWALGIKHPTRISATSFEAPKADPQITPESLVVEYTFPATDLTAGPLPLTWYDPPHKPDAISTWNLPASLAPEAVMFIGDKGMLCSNYTQHVLLPADQYKDYPRPAKSIPSSPGHQAEWINACLASDPSKTSCPFSYGGPLSESALLGPIAYRVGRPLDWDAAKLRFADNEEANQLVHYQYREGWSL